MGDDVWLPPLLPQYGLVKMNTIKFFLKILFVFIVIYIGLFYLAGYLILESLNPNNLNWIFDIVQISDKEINHELALKLIEITISALAFTGLVASIIFQRKELLTAQSQLQDQADNIQRSIIAANRNFEREILRDFSKQLKLEINNSNFQDIDIFIERCKELISLAESMDVVNINFSMTLTQIKLSSSILIIPPTIKVRATDYI